MPARQYPFYTLYESYIPKENLESYIQLVGEFNVDYYTQHNLKQHIAYLADEQPRRISHAYSTGIGYKGSLPCIELTDKQKWLKLCLLQSNIAYHLGLDYTTRTLFNVQEYFGGSEPVQKHKDGEWLDFSLENGVLDVKRTIRPERVAVLTLVNDTDGGGTRLHFPDDSEEVVRCKAGDLLVFDNFNCSHSVDQLTGTVKRADGLLRLIIGWRSLSERTWYVKKDEAMPLTIAEAEEIQQNWFETEWPQQWEKINATAQKAAF